jgi:hypothetical protein
MRTRTIIILLISLFLMIFMAACNTPTQRTSTPLENETKEPDSFVQESEIEGYPVAETPTVQDASEDVPYPAPIQVAVESAYPGEVLKNSNAIVLAFDHPIKSTDTLLTGVGPAGLEIYVLDITFMGAELGRAIIDKDGTFSIAVNDMQPGIRIGLSADISSIGLTQEDVIPGNGEISMPRIGYFFDSAVLTE